MTRSYVQLDKAKNNLGSKMDAEKIGEVMRQTVQLGGDTAGELVKVKDNALSVREGGNPGAPVDPVVTVTADLSGNWQMLGDVNTGEDRQKYKILNVSVSPMFTAYSFDAPDNAFPGVEAIPGTEADGLAYHLLEDEKVHQGRIWVRWTAAVAGDAFLTIWKRS